MKNPKYFFYTLLLISLCPFSFSAQETTPSINKKIIESPKYRIGQIFHFTDPKKLFMTISVSRSSFSREKMIALAQRIRSDYPKEPQISVIILDKFKPAKRISAGKADNPNYTKDHEAVRGYYSLNETAGIEYIKFSTKRGQPETRIDLNIGKENTNK